MGYSEVVCHLCGVSFSIARIRAITEPRESAWRSSDWDASEGTFVMGDGYSWRGCSSETGCYVTVRAERKTDPLNQVKVTDEDVKGKFVEGYDEEEDGDYVDGESEEDEPLEYDSDTEERGVEMEDLSHAEEEEGLYCEDYITLQHNLVSEEKQAPKGDIFYPVDISAGDTFETALWEREKSNHGPEQEVSLIGVEHIAGAACLDDRGYNGNFIAASEMKHCTHYQMLAYKQPGWKEEKDDEEWEKEGEVFLTGIGDRFPSRDMAFPNVYPPRHGWDEMMADTYSGGMSNGEVAMPFHPACFDIFTRLSKQKFGMIDSFGLMAWRNLSWSGIGAEKMREALRHPDVKKASGSRWTHHRGDEYLAANPLYVPGLIPILEAASSNEPSFTQRDSAFTPLPSTSSTTHREINQEGEDPFLRLPQEIREQAIDYLDSKDIAALRLASRAFYALPISLWYKLLRREMPWLWEVDSSQVPSFWTALEVIDLKREAKEREEYEESKAFRRNVIRRELPEILEEWENDQPKFAGANAKGKAEEIAKKAGKVLQKERMNWYVLYRDVRKAKLKGLNNRERIWGDVGRIVAEIGGMRENLGDWEKNAVPYE